MSTPSASGMPIWDTSDPPFIPPFSGALGTALDLKFSELETQIYSWADAAERGVQAGMLANAQGYQRNTDTTYRYNGTDWKVWEKAPALTSVAPTGVVLGTSGTATCLYGISGGRASGHLEIVFGAGGSHSAASRFAFPVAPAASLIAFDAMPIGTGLFWDASASSRYHLDTASFSDGIWGLRSVAASNTNYLDVTPIPSTGPTVAAAGDRVRLEFSYTVG